jgi:hypothetical protein
MAFTFTEYSVSVGTSAISFTNGNTTIATNTSKGFVQVFWNILSMAAGDEYELEMLEKVISSGSQVSVYKMRIPFGAGIGAYIPSMLGNGWEFTFKKMSGTDRTCQLSMRRAPE